MPSLEQLEKRAQQLKAQIQAKKALVRQQERKRDTRRKILIGAWLMDQKDTEFLREKMDRYLTRDNDRKLFGLPPK